MKRLFGLIAVLLLVLTFSGEQANSQLIGPGGGGGGGSGAANSIQFTNGSLPITSASAAAQCLQTNAGNTGVVLGSCGGGATYPAGNAPQIGGFSALNTSEAETVSGDAAFTRAGVNSYTIAVTKTNGTAFGAAATLGVGAGLTSTGGNITLTTPVSVANGGHGSGTAPSAGQIPIAQSATSYTPNTISGDSTLSSAGVMQNLALHFGAANAVGLPVTPPTSGGIPFFSSTTTLASSSVLTANLPVIGGGAGVAPGVGTVTGNTTKFATSTGTLTSNDCAKWDASGNIIDAGAACGTGGTGTNPIFTHTITLSAGAATMSIQSSTTAAIDTDYVAVSANATITTPAAAGMADGQEIYLIGSTSGSAFTVGFTAGTGVTLATIVLGDASPFGTPAACGTIPATGSAWYKWKYSSSNTTLTLIACGISAPAAALNTTLGGTGLINPTAHSILLGEGSSPLNTIAAATSGNIVIDQGAGADWLSKPVTGDATLSLTGALTVTKTNGTAFGALATLGVGTGLTSSGGNLNLTTPVTLANGGTGQTATSAWPIATNVNTSVGAATNISPSATFWITNQDITMTAAATITLLVPSWANQMENLKVCQNGTGGFAPTFAQGAGLTITGTFPTCTTTASKCCDIGLYFDSTSTAYITGSNAGPI